MFIKRFSIVLCLVAFLVAIFEPQSRPSYSAPEQQEPLDYDDAIRLYIEEGFITDELVDLAALNAAVQIWGLPFNRALAKCLTSDESLVLVNHVIEAFDSINWVSITNTSQFADAFLSPPMRGINSMLQSAFASCGGTFGVNESEFGGILQLFNSMNSEFPWMNDVINPFGSTTVEYMICTAVILQHQDNHCTDPNATSTDTDPHPPSGDDDDEPSPTDEESDKKRDELEKKRDKAGDLKDKYKQKDDDPNKEEAKREAEKKHEEEAERAGEIVKTAIIVTVAMPLERIPKWGKTAGQVVRVIAEIVGGIIKSTYYCPAAYATQFDSSNPLYGAAYQIEGNPMTVGNLKAHCDCLLSPQPDISNPMCLAENATRAICTYDPTIALVTLDNAANRIPLETNVCEKLLISDNQERVLEMCPNTRCPADQVVLSNCACGQAELNPALSLPGNFCFAIDCPQGSYPTPDCTACRTPEPFPIECVGLNCPELPFVFWEIGETDGLPVIHVYPEEVPILVIREE